MIYSSELLELLKIMGSNLKASRKTNFPGDNQERFAARIQVSRATYQKMEKGDPAVSLGSYLQAAEILGQTSHFATMFAEPGDQNLLEGVDL